MYCQNAVQWHYNAVNFLTNIHKGHPIGRPLSYVDPASDWYSTSVPVVSVSVIKIPINTHYGFMLHIRNIYNIKNMFSKITRLSRHRRMLVCKETYKTYCCWSSITRYWTQYNRQRTNTFSDYERKKATQYCLFFGEWIPWNIASALYSLLLYMCGNNQITFNHYVLLAVDCSL